MQLAEFFVMCNNFWFLLHSVEQDPEPTNIPKNILHHPPAFGDPVGYMFHGFEVKASRNSSGGPPSLRG